MGEIACKEWLDVRTFGQVFAFKGDEVSLGIRGPVSIHQAVSLSPVDIVSMQITKSVNSEAGKDSKASDTMGTKYRIGFGLYLIKGSVNVQLAEKTGFSQEDSELLKEALKTLFENDASSARPEGSMEVCRLYWWQHNEKTPSVSTAKIHRSIHIKSLKERPKSFGDYSIELMIWNVLNRRYTTLYKEEDYLQLSGIQHFAFCRRQWALAYIELQWKEKCQNS